MRDVVAAAIQQLRRLVAAAAAQDLLEADQIGREAIDPFADPRRALGPGTLVVPEVQREHRERHQSQCGFIASG